MKQILEITGDDSDHPLYSLLMLLADRIEAYDEQLFPIDAL